MRTALEITIPSGMCIAPTLKILSKRGFGRLTHRSFLMTTPKSCSLAILALVCIAAPSLWAQNPRIQHTITRSQHQPASLGRDFWFGLIQNEYSDLGGKYFALYLTSP